MCGIAGFVQKGNRASNINIERMLKSLSHRGPNGNGVIRSKNCTLAHTRLAVIDPTPSGKQPMYRDNVYLTFNGEIYNFQEHRDVLEQEGFQFQGHSDAEVLLALYLMHGIDCLKKIRGMYAFAIWDEKIETLFCVRDPIGIKPFFYSDSSHSFVFASELKALLASTAVSKNIDLNVLQTTLMKGSQPQPDSIISDVSSLEPGHLLTLRSGKIEIKRFHNFECKVDEKLTLNDAIPMAKKLLDEIIQEQMISDVPIGAFLSGGIDSSLLVALISKRFSNLNTFSIGFESDDPSEQYDESDDALIIAQHLGVRHHKFSITANDVQNDLRAFVRGLDHPSIDGLNSWFVSKVAKEHLTVAISGTGGDELFGGYPWFHQMQMFSQQSFPTKLLSIAKGKNFSREYNSLYQILSPQLSKQLLPSASAANLPKDPYANSSLVNRVTGMVLCGYTQNQLLNDIDTTSMAHSLEVRVPLLDERLVQFALNLPDSVKLSETDKNSPFGSYAYTGAKKLLLELGKDILPSSFAHKPKRGFLLPYASWLRGALAPELDSALSFATVKKRGWFCPQTVNHIHDCFMDGHLPWTYVWMLMITELWAQEVLDA